jgi:hypothetical protein
MHFRVDVHFIAPEQTRGTRLKFGENGKNGASPLGIEQLLNVCGLNNFNMWMSSKTLLIFGVLCPRAKSTTALIESRIDTLAHLYPVTDKVRALGVATHERENLRGYHLFGDDSDIAHMWASLFSYESSIQGWDVAAKAMCWTAMAPGCVYVPYLDIDERGLEDDFHRIWIERVTPTLESIQRRLMSIGVQCKPLVLANKRDTGELWKFSFHVHWSTLGVKDVSSWKNFLLSIPEMPRKLNWKKSGNGWDVSEDPKTPIFDPAVYGGQRQLFRGPFCGKEGNLASCLVPCVMSKNDEGKFELSQRTYTVDAMRSIILEARIARWPTGLTMVEFPEQPQRASHRSEKEDLPMTPRLAEVIEGEFADVLNFCKPFFVGSILPKWQEKRRADMVRLNAQGAQVPVKNLRLVKDVPHRYKPGCRFMAVDGDTFCYMDEAHTHRRSRSAIGLCVDFMNCTIEQTCFACGKDAKAEKFCFLHAGNRVDIQTEADSAFTGLSHWTPAKMPYQLLLDYFEDIFLLQRGTRSLWVYDEWTCIWKTDMNGNAVVGVLVDDLNEKFVKYLTCYKKHVLARQIEAFKRANRDEPQPIIDKHILELNQGARKFMADNTPFISLSPASRGKIMDDLKSFHIHREIMEMNCVPQLIPMKNRKFINVFTGDIGDMKKEHCFTSCVNAEVIPLGDETRRLEEWFLEIATGEREKAVFFKRFGAYCLTYLVHDRRFIVFKGCGKNAKGALKEFIMKISKGPEGMDSRAKNLLQNYWASRSNAVTSPENATPESYELMNKTILYTDDIMPVHLDTNKLKRIVGGEEQSGRGLYGKPVDIRVKGKVVWTTNFDPDGPGEDNAYWERCLIVPMLTKYVAPGQPVNPTQYRFAQNHVVYNELLEMLDAFFTVAVNELVRYYKGLPWNPDKGTPANLSVFPVPVSVEKYNQEARARQLPLAGYMKDYTREEKYPGNFIRIEELFDGYMTYLDNVNETRIKKDTTQTTFIKLLAIALDVQVEHGYVQGRAMTKKVISSKQRHHEDRSYGGMGGDAWQPREAGPGEEWVRLSNGGFGEVGNGRKTF